ncbi:hypothetical protein ACJ73_10096 [Blastomyces percursus]|uniref:Small ribosomal subunit protein mS41 n=1 Tax=Blastomyces percursus TaxID=1658174 RepID=A0A1J9Q0I2_9EURO|nr:hypothetical protein ACJ73_10096 [Blastomyces percursus]
MVARTIPRRPFTPSFLTTPPTSYSHFSSPSHQFLRQLHKSSQTPVPPPTPFVPDAETFLSLIGRNMSRFAPKFTSWDELFSLSSVELKARGIEPPRLRRYLLRWRQKFQRGEYGIGGDLEHVVDGVGRLKIVEIPSNPVPTRADGQGETPTITAGGQREHEIPPTAATGSATLSPGMKWAVVNLPPGESQPKEIPQPLKKYMKVRLGRGPVLKAPYIKLVKGTNGMAGVIQVQEGMWEDKQGRKIDGGERRQAEVRAKKRSEDRKRASV